MQTVLIVEDHTDTRAWLAELVQEALGETRILAAGTLEQARAHLAAISPAVALIDLSLPDGHGLDLLQELQAQHAQTVRVVHTIFDDDQHVFEALRAGATGYLLKDQPGPELVESLRGIVSGRPPLSPAIVRRLLRYFQQQPAEPTDQDPRVELTEREQEVLTLLAKGIGRSDIAAMLGVSVNTAASHIKAIYHKLNVSGRAEATLEAVRLGLVGQNKTPTQW